jgi:hypothetical protein
LSLGGSVGKTLFVTQVLYPNMPNAKILAVDSVNQTAKDFGIKNCQLHSGDEFNKTYRALMSSLDDVIVDVGGSKECKEFMNGMMAIDGSDEVTRFIIPSRPSSKDQSCAIETIAHLLDGNVEKSKISVVFTDVKKSVEDEFQQLINWMLAVDLKPDLNLMIQHSPIYGEMIENKELIVNVLADETDYKEKAANRSEGDHTDYIGKLMRQRMARNQAWPNLQNVFKHLFPEG